VFSRYLHHSFRAFPGSWTREGEWLVARWPLRHRRGQVYELETALQVDEDVPAESPPAPAALAALLLPAMRRGRYRILLPAPLDATTQANLLRLQARFADLFPEFELQRVPVRTRGSQTRPAPRPGGGRVGVFASLGVDAFFSLLSHLDEIDDLILVRGYNIGLEPEHDALWSEAVEAARAVAGELGKRLVPVRTNIRTFLEQRICPWGLSHGAALAHVALLLQPWLRTVYVPSSFDVSCIFPWGSHPELDPLWSTGQLQIVHDGTEYRRVEKVHRIAESPVVLRHLRVCNAHPGGAYNCGRCSKCIHTMLALDSVGALKGCATFPQGVAASDIRAVPAFGVGGCIFLGEIRDWWRENDPEHELLPLVEEILERAEADDRWNDPERLQERWW